MSPTSANEAVIRATKPTTSPTSSKTEAIAVDIPADILNVHCPSRTVLRHVTDRWTPMIVTVLTPRRKVRFKELRERVQGISPKVLTETLRSLERDGLVTRVVTASVPPRVDYELTDLGESITEPIQALREWAEGHVQEVEAHRAQFDAMAE